MSVVPPVADGRGQWMRMPDEVAAMLRLRDLGWGTRRIAAELGCNRETVQRYLGTGGWAPYRTPERPGALAGHGAWLAERLRRHRGNADVVRQELAAELGLVVSLRTVERAVADLRRELAAEALATVQYGGKPTYQAIILAQPGLRIEKFPEDARGMSISFADAGSTSGWLIPSHWFQMQGIDPKTFFKYRDGASHAANVTAVANGQVDLATDYDRNLAAMIAAGRVRED